MTDQVNYLWPYGQWGCWCGYWNEGRGEDECARCGKRRSLPWYIDRRDGIPRGSVNWGD